MKFFNKNNVYFAFLAITALSVGFLISIFVGRVAGKNETYIALFTVTVTFIAGMFSMAGASLMNMVSKRKRVFLSYSRDSHDLARDLAFKLREVGVKVWLDMDSIKPGDSISASVQGALIEADFLVVLLPKEYNRHLDFELEVANSAGIKIIPVRLDFSETPESLSDIMYIDFRSDKEKGIKELIDAVR